MYFRVPLQLFAARRITAPAELRLVLMNHGGCDRSRAGRIAFLVELPACVEIRPRSPTKVAAVAPLSTIFTPRLGGGQPLEPVVVALRCALSGGS